MTPLCRSSSAPLPVRSYPGGETGYYTEDNLPDDSYATLTDPSVNTLDPAAG